MSKTTYENPSSNISYTNKDFESIYPELLDLVKKLTNKWDPSLSNESDPGVLLIKELAILGDKLNYNIDKNVLECFPLSVTQQNNARKLYEQLGYMMHWYVAAIGDIGFRLTKSLDDLKLSGESFKIDQFTQLTNSDGNISYVTLNDVQLVDTSTIQYVPCIQGVIHDYVINGSTDITINNLDANLRLYLPETMIAENGIFIKAASEPFYDTNDGWKLVDNLVSYESGNKVFKFGVLANSNTCYIEFPQDIANIFSTENISALNIKYVTTSGLNGNVSARTIETIANELNAKTIDSSDISMNDNIKVLQPRPIVNGKNIESLEDAYFNYKKTIGVFNTLVTQRDYESFVYNAQIDAKNIVSNVVVADRTNDINVTNYVQTWIPDGNRKELTLLYDPETGAPKMSAYDVNLYVTLPALSVNNESTYNSTFKPQTMGASGDASLALIEINALAEDIKSSQHDLRFVNKSSESKFNINVNYIVRGLLTTYNKVTREEAKDISNNVKKALYEKCNNRELNYGEELGYDKLVDIISNADARIRTFMLTALNYEPRMITGDPDKTFPMNTSVGGAQSSEVPSYNNEMIARMVLAGNVQLFEFDDNFSRNFNQVDVIESAPITTITTEAAITIPNNASPPYKVKVNEYVQALAPSLIVETEYAGDLYVTSTIDIPADTDVFIGKNTISVDNISGYSIPHSLSNCIVNCSESLSADTEKHLGPAGYLKVKRINKVQLQSGLPYYLILNNSENKLELAPDEQKILDEGEYLIYSSIGNTDELVILGSGTAIKALQGGLDYQNDKVEITDNNLNNVPWKILLNPIEVIEMDIRSFGTGVNLYLQSSQEPLSIDNSETNLNGAILHYDLPGSEGGKLTYIDGYADYTWYVKSRLQINSSINAPQRLYGNQKITYTTGDENNPIESTIVGSDDSAIYVQFNESLILPGGENIDLRRLDDNGEWKPYLRLYKYRQTDSSNSTTNHTYKLADYAGTKKITLEYSFNQQTFSSQSYLIPVYTNLGTSTQIQVAALKYASDGASELLRTPITAFGRNTAVTLSGVNAYTLQIPLNNDYDAIELSFTSLESNDNIYIGDIVKLSGFNSQEIDSDTYKIQLDTNSDISWNGTKVIKEIINLLDSSKTIYNQSLNNSFNWTYKVSAEDKVLDPTSSASYWNVNHIYHNYAIPKIDFKKFDVSVNPGNII